MGNTGSVPEWREGSQKCVIGKSQNISDIDSDVIFRWFSFYSTLQLLVTLWHFNSLYNIWYNICFTDEKITWIIMDFLRNALVHIWNFLCGPNFDQVVAKACKSWPRNDQREKGGRQTIRQLTKLVSQATHGLVDNKTGFCIFWSDDGRIFQIGILIFFLLN